MNTTTIHQECQLQATPDEIYAAWMSSEQHRHFTGQEANISPKVGGVFHTFDGWASGKNVELIPGRKIVQSWRGDDWPAGHFSTVTLRLQATANGTRVMFDQENIPTGVAKAVAKGWRDYYWSAMRSTFGW